MDLLDTPLLRLTPQDSFTVRDAVQSVAVFGGIGSGKTSGTGKALAGAYLRAGMGGLVLCAKPEEAELWRHYVAAHGRAASLIEFDGKQHGFNFIAYELARQGAAGINSVVECLMHVLEASRIASRAGGKPSDQFWEDTTRQLLRNTLPFLFAARGTITIPDIIAFVRSAPRSRAQMVEADWQRQSIMYEIFSRAIDRMDQSTAKKMMLFWRDEYASLDDKTRGNITISLTTALDRFNHGWLEHTFCQSTTVVPELTFHGAIILLNMPALTLNADGIVAQHIFKYMWQRAVLNRNSLPDVFRQRPVFLWADEAQYFVSKDDADFQSTCRGSRACTVYLSQNLPTYYAMVPEQNGVHRVQQLLGNFATKIFHNNSCTETNKWAADMLGRAPQRRASYSENEGSTRSYGQNYSESKGGGTNSGSNTSYSAQGGSSGASWGRQSNYGESWGENEDYSTNSGTNRGWSEQMDYVMEPAQFSRVLKTGGPHNGNQVSAVWYQAGRTFRTSHGNALLAVFNQ